MIDRLQKNVRIVTPRYQQILGVKFFSGDVDEAVAFMFRQAGFRVAPFGTCFARLREDERYRRAMPAADLAIADFPLGDSCFNITASLRGRI